MHMGLIEKVLDVYVSLSKEEVISFWALFVSFLALFASFGSLYYSRKQAIAATVQAEILKSQELGRKEDQSKASVVLSSHQSERSMTKIKIENIGVAEARNVRLYLNEKEVRIDDPSSMIDGFTQLPIDKLDNRNPVSYTIFCDLSNSGESYRFKVKWDDDCQLDNEYKCTIKL
jgi:hypothetical protein